MLIHSKIISSIRILVSLFIDPIKTIQNNKVQIGAFRTYPRNNVSITSSTPQNDESFQISTFQSPSSQNVSENPQITPRSISSSREKSPDNKSPNVTSMKEIYETFDDISITNVDDKLLPSDKIDDYGVHKNSY